MNKLLLVLVLVGAAVASGCAPLVVAGAGAAGYAGWEYEFRSCVRNSDGHYVSRRWANLNPRRAHCLR